MISFIVPAHNEQAVLGKTLQAIHDSIRDLNHPYEIIVVDDASTDPTADIALQNNARVISVNHRQIAATRNSGGQGAKGEKLFFVDADTVANPIAVAAAIRAMDRGGVGGGAPTWFSRKEKLPLYVRLLALEVVLFAKLVGFTGGAFMFCTREAFLETGGFDEQMYWAEEITFALALKRCGRFVVLWKPVLTSGRRFRTTSGLQMLATVARTALRPRKMVTRRASVEKIWYDSNRSNDDFLSRSLLTRVSNGLALFILIALLSGPLWNFIPDIFPLSHPIGMTRLMVGILLCHVGLLLWPISVVLVVNLLRQKRCTGLVQSLALVAFCAWQAWNSSLGVVWTWNQVYRWFI
jgi:cellulose synthase/poly-beta-1,6-N-acetylglucosamine synthase-like glycosyltransferase